jgi:hypothetical protein
MTTASLTPTISIRRKNMNSYYEPPDEDWCECAALTKELGFCECYIDQILEEEDEHLTNNA